MSQSQKLTRCPSMSTFSLQSHDQALDQNIAFIHPTNPQESFSFHMLGGTTKCARTFAQYLFAKHLAMPGIYYQKKVLEVGAGTGESFCPSHIPTQFPTNFHHLLTF